MKLGIGSFAFAWAVGVPGHPPAQPLDAFGLLRKARSLGVSVVQLCDNLPLQQWPATSLADLKYLADDLDIRLELGTRGLDAGLLEKYLELAVQWQASFVRVVIDRPGDEPSLSEAIRRLKPITATFAQAGVGLAIENHDRFSCRSLVELVTALGPQTVGICLDTVNSFGALEGPEAVIQALGPFTLSLHVKDFTIRRLGHQMGFAIEGCPAGRGRLNVPWLISQLHGMNRDVNAILEQWPARSDSLAETIAREEQWAVESINYLRKLFV